jgi:hypothetical protein
MKRVLFSLALLTVSSVAVSDKPHGGSWKDAKVADITVHAAGGTEGKGYVVVTFAANGAGGPSCASGYPRSVVIDISTPGGAFAAAISQSAFLMGPLGTVTVTGTGTCSVSPSIETVDSVQETQRDPGRAELYNGNPAGLRPPQSGH